MTAAAIARLKITLDDVKPQVVRRIEVPLAIRLARLHLALQAAIGWTDTHLYELRANDVGWGVPDPGSGGGPLDARKARLVDVLEDLGTKTLRYLYDFGDGWEHPIKIERIDVALTGTLYPRLLEGTGHCPPEDVGGGATKSSWQPLRPEAPTSCRVRRVDGTRNIRPYRRRLRRLGSRRAGPRQTVGAKAERQAQAYRPNRGLRRRVTVSLPPAQFQKAPKVAAAAQPGDDAQL